MLFQGEAFAEFKDLLESHTQIPYCDAVRLINTQTEIITNELSLPQNTPSQRRQSIVFLLEQCLMLCTLPNKNNHQVSRFRRIVRLVHRARRVARADLL